MHIFSLSCGAHEPLDTLSAITKTVIICQLGFFFYYYFQMKSKMPYLAWNNTVLSCHSAGCDKIIKMVRQNATVAQVLILMWFPFELSK